MPKATKVNGRGNILWSLKGVKMNVKRAQYELFYGKTVHKTTLGKGREERGLKSPEGESLARSVGLEVFLIKRRRSRPGEKIAIRGHSARGLRVLSRSHEGLRG